MSIEITEVSLLEDGSHGIGYKFNVPEGYAKRLQQFSHEPIRVNFMLAMEDGSIVGKKKIVKGKTCLAPFTGILVDPPIITDHDHPRTIPIQDR